MTGDQRSAEWYGTTSDAGETTGCVDAGEMGIRQSRAVRLQLDSPQLPSSSGSQKPLRSGHGAALRLRKLCESARQWSDLAGPDAFEKGLCWMAGGAMCAVMTGRSRKAASAVRRRGHKKEVQVSLAHFALSDVVPSRRLQGRAAVRCPRPELAQSRGTSVQST